ncbi:hypothetical protein [Rickettsia felis]|nr:hypothetical protein [Rickettsia felis]
MQRAVNSIKGYVIPTKVLPAWLGFPSLREELQGNSTKRSQEFVITS